MKFTYLLIDLASVSIPFVFSFHPRIRFYKEWKFFLPVLFFVTIIFCIWDALFTQLGVWGFSAVYTTGKKIFNLPLEEVLFFICIPYACAFTFHCFRIFKVRNFFPKTVRIATVLSLALLICSGIFFSKLYPLVTFLLLAAFLLLLRKKNYLGLFFTTYLLLLIPFFVVNGILTGTGLKEPVVWYNPEEIIGLRLFTIPVEDIFYGMLMVLLNVAGMQWMKEKFS